MPAGQAEQLDAPAVDQAPAAQLVHAVAEVAPVAADAVPAAHGVQLESLAAAQKPATHESEASSVKPPIPPPSWLNLAQLPRCT